MKNKILIAIFGAVVLCYYSCDGSYEKSKYTRFENHDQNMLDSIVGYYYEKDHKILSNQLAQKELFDEYRARVTEFFDSVEIKNWSALIQRIRTTHEFVPIAGVPHQRIEFNLLDNAKEAPKIEYTAAYYVMIDSLESDTIYNTLKACGNLERVNFSGEIRKVNKTGTYVLYDYSEHSPQIAYPKFSIILTGLTRTNKYR